MSQPWRKLHRKVPTRWSTMSLLARALGTELRRYSDDDDRIDLGGRDPSEAIARLCGATAGERRMLPKLLSELVEAGYVERVGGALVLRPEVSGDASSRARTQHEPSTNLTRVVHEPDTNPTRTEHEPITSGARTDHENADKSAQPLNSAPVDKSRVEERESREEDSRAVPQEPERETPSPRRYADVAPARPRQPTSALTDPSPEDCRKATARALTSVSHVADTRREIRDLDWSGWHSLASWAHRSAQLTGSTPRERLNAALHGWLAATADRGCPIGFLAKNPDQYATTEAA